MDRTRILRRALELKFKGKRPMECHRTRWFSLVLKTRREGGADNKLKRRDHGKTEEIEDFLCTNLYKMETILLL
jgi:hypothetical protein